MLLSRNEWRAVRTAWRLLDLPASRVILAVMFGALGLGSSVALTATAAWLIARASQMPPVLALSVASVGVRTFGIARSVFRYAERLASHDVALRGMSTLREQVYMRLAEAPVERVAGLRRGDLLVRTGADVDSVGDLVVRALLPMAVALTVGIGTVSLVTWLNPLTGLILLACLVLSGTIGPLLAARAARADERAQVAEKGALGATAMTLLEGGSELTVAGTYGVVRAQLSEHERRLDRLRDRAARPAALAAGTDILGMALAVLGAIVVGLSALSAGTLSPVELAVAVLTPLAAFEGTAALGPAAVQLVTSAAAAERIVDIIEAPVDTRTREIPADAASELGVRDLAVGWPGGPTVAEGISLRVAPGRAIAIVGPSGIGKTTLLATLAGLLAPHAGTVSCAGAELSDATRESVARHVTMTAEDSHIFATTVLENIRVARGDVTADEARALLARCGLKAWLEGLPEGVDTMLGSDGATISGGERRRLLVARALASPAPLLLIDEPAEHLDGPTAAALMTDLLAMKDQGRGVVVVTHHLGSLEHADQVIWLDSDGHVARVRDAGTHTELMRRHPPYASASQEV